MFASVGIFISIFVRFVPMVSEDMIAVGSDVVFLILCDSFEKNT